MFCFKTNAYIANIYHCEQHSFIPLVMNLQFSVIYLLFCEVFPKYIAKLFNYYIASSVWREGACCSMHACVRGQLCTVCVLLPPSRGIQGSTSSLQTSAPIPFPTSRLQTSAPIPFQPHAFRPGHQSLSLMSHLCQELPSLPTESFPNKLQKIAA